MKRAVLMSVACAGWWVAAALGLAGCGGGNDGPMPPRVLSSVMTGEQEVPAAVTGAIGSGTLSVDPVSSAVTGSIVIDGLNASAAHVHIGDAGVSGPVIVPLVQGTPGVWSVPAGSVLTGEQVLAYRSGGLYFNAHTAAYPNGEIRGQIGRDVFDAPLSPLQEVPPPASTASGAGRLTLDPATGRFVARVTTSGIAGNAAHIHAARPGVSGQVVFPLTETAAGSGVWVSAADATMSEAQMAQLRAGELYFNVHSAAYPGGEIRGQIARHVGIARLSGAQEVPATSSAATGTGTLVIDPATRAASGELRLSGMTASQAHVHIAAPGVNGPVIIPLTNTATNVWSVPAGAKLTAEQFLAFKQGNLYFNAHTAQFPGGEIRGQLR